MAETQPRFAEAGLHLDAQKVARARDRATVVLLREVADLVHHSVRVPIATSLSSFVMSCWTRTPSTTPARARAARAQVARREVGEHEPLGA